MPKRKLCSKRELKYLYLTEKMSIPKIAQKFSVTCWTVWHWFKNYGIKTRTRSEALKGSVIPRDVREKISKAKRGKHSSPATEFTRERVLGERNPFFGKKHSEKTKQKISLAKKGKHVHSVEFKKKQARLTRDRWSDPEYKRRVVSHMLKSLISKPTRPEQRVVDLMERCRLPFHYVGNGGVIIGGLNPDFIHNNGKRKVIEVFGKAFHDPEVSFRKQIPWYQQYWGRMAYYAQCGYDCLILWDDELDDEKEVVGRIGRFLNE